MIEALIGLGVGAFLAKAVLMPLQTRLAERQDRLDRQRAAELAAESFRRYRGEEATPPPG